MYTKEQKREFRKINRSSAEIIRAVDELAATDKIYPFSRRALTRDRRSEYAPEDIQELSERDEKPYREATEMIKGKGIIAAAHAMRKYVDIISNSEEQEADRECAMKGAIQLLFTISRLADSNTEKMNQVVMEACAKDASLESICAVTKKQLLTRQLFLSPETVQTIRQNMLQNG